MFLTIDRTDEAAARAAFGWAIAADPYPTSIPAPSPQCGQCLKFWESRHKPGIGCCRVSEQTRSAFDSAVGCHWYEEDCPF